MFSFDFFYLLLNVFLVILKGLQQLFGILPRNFRRRLLLLLVILFLILILVLVLLLLFLFLIFLLLLVLVFVLILVVLLLLHPLGKGQVVLRFKVAGIVPERFFVSFNAFVDLLLKEEAVS